MNTKIKGLCTFKETIHEPDRCKNFWHLAQIFLCLRQLRVHVGKNIFKKLLKYIMLTLNSSLNFVYLYFFQSENITCFSIDFVKVTGHATGCDIQLFTYFFVPDYKTHDFKWMLIGIKKCICTQLGGRNVKINKLQC